MVLITIVVHSQTFDYSTKKLSVNDDGVIENKNFTFTINNINTFKYDVLIDNTIVNYNTKVPDLFKAYLPHPDSIQSFDTATTANKEQGASFSDLYSNYIKLNTSELFYDALVSLVSSDLPTNIMIDYKKAYYKQFIGSESPNDDIAFATIVKYYSDIINSISFKTPAFNPKETSKKRLQSVDTILIYTKEIEFLKIPQKLASLYCAINAEKFTVRKFIKRPDADELIINIVATPNLTYNKNNSEIKTDVPLSVKGGWKLDFSSGIFLSNLADYEYVNKPNYITDSITGYYLTKSNNNPLAYGIAAFLHSYYRFAKAINVSLTLGVGIDQNTQVKVMPGLSLILGTKERFIINGGAAIGKSKDLSIVQDANHLYKEKTEPVYTESYKVKVFLGISYNLSK